MAVYTRVQVEHVYKSNPIFEAKNTTFLEKTVVLASPRSNHKQLEAGDLFF